MPEPLFIGIDGGGTKCRARIRDAAGSLVGEGIGGPANVRLDPSVVMQSIIAASLAAAKAGGLPQTALQGAHAGLGLAGAGQRESVQRLLAQPHPFAAVAVETDAYAAWLGAHGGDDGAILILGTGSCGLAVVGGQRVYVSGWGAEVSDEASGAAIGREAIRRSLWAYDGRSSPTPLSDEILSQLGGTPERVVAFATDARPADYGRFAPLVFDHAGRRDPLGMALISAAAADAAGIINRLLEVGAPAVCLLGGVAERLEPWIAPPFQGALAAPKGDALEGALLLARDAAKKAAAVETIPA